MSEYGYCMACGDSVPVKRVRSVVGYFMVCEQCGRTIEVIWDDDQEDDDEK